MDGVAAFDWLGISALVFQNHVGHREACGMRDRKRGVSYAQLRGNLGGAAMEAQVGATAGLPHHFDLQPVHASADACSEGLGAGLFGGKPSGQAFGRIAFAQAVGLLGGGEDAIQKSLSVALKRLLDARDFNQVNTAADDHAVYQTNIRNQGL